MTTPGPRPRDHSRGGLGGAVAQERSNRPLPGGIHEIGDRATAIREAVARAGAGDTVVVLGKGHEIGQEIAGVVHPSTIEHS